MFEFCRVTALEGGGVRGSHRELRPGGCLGRVLAEAGHSCHLLVLAVLDRLRSPQQPHAEQQQRWWHWLHVDGGTGLVNLGCLGQERARQLAVVLSPAERTCGAVARAALRDAAINRLGAEEPGSQFERAPKRAEQRLDQKPDGAPDTRPP